MWTVNDPIGIQLVGRKDPSIADAESERKQRAGGALGRR